MSSAAPVTSFVATPRSGRRIALIALVIALAAGSGVLWDKVIKHRVVARNFAAVEPGVFYRSGQVSRHLIERTLREHRIGLILFMSEDKPDRPDVQAEADAALRLGIRRLNLPLAGDGTGDLASYVEALVEMHAARQAGVPTLVHCHTGSQRTSGVVGFYQLLVEGRDAAQVYRDMRRHGHDPRDNPRLIPYMNEHMPALAERLVARGVLPRAPETIPQLPS